MATAMRHRDHSGLIVDITSRSYDADPLTKVRHQEWEEMTRNLICGYLTN